MTRSMQRIGYLSCLNPLSSTFCFSCALKMQLVPLFCPRHGNRHGIHSGRRLSFAFGFVDLGCNKTLEILQTEKVFVQKLKLLPLPREGAASPSCIDKWLELVLENYINELHLYILFCEYTLPSKCLQLNHWPY